jgi:peptidoglycan/xylan/chitin deacetylase (PgdA/CDA1 family)
MSQLPTAYVSTLHAHRPERARDGMTIEALDALVEQLADAEVRSPSLSSLVRGRLSGGQVERGALFVLADSRLATIAEWAGSLAASGYTSLVVCASAELGRDGHIGTGDVPLLTGHGIVLASQGTSGRPLIGLSLEDLRHELTDSRQRLSRLAGYQVRTLLPTPSTFGNAVDGLILEEAQRAGYELVLQPGRSITELDDPSPGARVLNYRTLRTDDSPARLRDWIVDRGLARPLAQVSDLVNRPRRILSRFGID